MVLKEGEGLSELDTGRPRGERDGGGSREASLNGGRDKNMHGGVLMGC